MENDEAHYLQANTKVIQQRKVRKMAVRSIRFCGIIGLRANLSIISAKGRCNVTAIKKKIVQIVGIYIKIHTLFLDSNPDICVVRRKVSSLLTHT